MPIVPIKDVGQIGIIEDIPPYSLPPNAWSGGNNVRFLDNGVSKCVGYEEVMATCPFAPFYIHPYLSAGGTYYWLAYGAEDIAVWDGSSWTDITRQAILTLDGTVSASAATIDVDTGATLTALDATGTLVVGDEDTGSSDVYEALIYSGRNTGTGVITLTGTTTYTHPDGAVVTPSGGTDTLDNDYGATEDTYKWTATNLNGLIVATNGYDTPQMWPLSGGVPAVGSPFMELRNWPSGTTCQVIRSFRTFLVGLNWDRTNPEPRLVKWSTEASYGQPPATWSETDNTLDAGEYQLADTPGDIIDGLPLGDSFLIYKNDSIYVMNYVGTPYIFSFKLLSPTIGCLAKNAVAEFEGGHFFIGNSDFYICNGQQVTPLLPDRLRRTVFDELNGDNYKKCFVAPDYVRNEMMACYPAGTSTVVNKAIIWNWKNNTFSIRDLPNTSHINSGIVAITAGAKWGASAVLNGAITPTSPATSGSLTVVTTTSTPAFTTSGTLILQGDTSPYVGEQITYTGVTGTTFTGITRGANLTTAASHDNSIAVNQVTTTWDGAAGPWGQTNYDNVAEHIVFARPGIKATITAATKANPVVITYTLSSYADQLSDGDSIIIDSVVGMTDLNGNTYTIANINTSAGTFELSGVEGTAYGTYTSGGQVVQPKIYRDSKGNTEDGTNMISYIERTGYDLDDPSIVKFVSAVYPKIEVSGNNSVNLYIGRQMSTEEGVDWNPDNGGAPYLYNPAIQSRVPCRISGKYFGIKVESLTDMDWKMHGVAFEVKPKGRRGSRMM